MKALIALEKLVKELEKRISIGKAQLYRHESGEEVLTLLVESSIETNLEKNTELLNRYRVLMKEFLKFEKLDTHANERIKIAIERKKYYKHSRLDIEKITVKNNDEKIEAALILNELPEDEKLDDREIYEISFKAIEEYLFLSSNSEELLKEIKASLHNSLNTLTQENINTMEILTYMIPMNIFHFYLLLSNINDTLDKNDDEEDEDEEEKKDLVSFPKYQDWWIEEIWTSHKAYFALYQWKQTIANLCKTEEQKLAWNKIFHNWIFIKSLLTEKNEMGFEYQYIFDNLLFEYVELESELNENQLILDKKKLNNFIEEEDFFNLIDDHNIITPYLKFKDLSE